MHPSSHKAYCAWQEIRKASLSMQFALFLCHAFLQGELGWQRSHRREAKVRQVPQGLVDVAYGEAGLRWVPFPHGVQATVLAQKHRVRAQGLVELPYLRASATVVVLTEAGGWKSMQ